MRQAQLRRCVRRGAAFVIHLDAYAKPQERWPPGLASQVDLQSTLAAAAADDAVIDGLEIVEAVLRSQALLQFRPVERLAGQVAEDGLDPLRLVL